MAKEEKMEQNVDETVKEEATEKQAAEEQTTEEQAAEEAVEDVEKSVNEAAKAEEAAMERLMRLQADFENYKKRTQKEKTDIYQFALEGFVTKLLPVLDNLDRAEAAADDDNADKYREGVQMVFKQLIGVLNEEGLQEIDCVGTAFDPNFHHGVAVGEDPEKDDQVVLEVFQKGYTFKDKVIRPAMVKVNQK
ncbi:nucleotide exchange factor GrpE [Eubacterium callanderi]|uniref:nucleotide exchange factor GrpE n=1 Tax=Eubacterium callanderi TaxID=53442 RepID=UPI0029FF310E|nr:nucleotide exchange factor GrpE [Eubacterium callanderi]WPK67397.1 Protein GrpE [Eubacterium callanderi]WPK71695.1 Protein GrpE [Eubacterium callanderi]